MSKNLTPPKGEVFDAGLGGVLIDTTKDYIGVFDSGLGGITVLKALYNNFPQENFVFVADESDLPFGDKPESELLEILKNVLAFYGKIKTEDIVIACNTMSSVFITNNLKQEHGNVITIVESLVDSLEKIYNADKASIKAVGVLATVYTVGSQIYPQVIRHRGIDVPIFQVGCDKLAPALEDNDPKVWEYAKGYIEQLPDEVTHLMLACTHYNLLYDKIKEEYKKFTIVPPYERVIEVLGSKIHKTTESAENKKPITMLTTKYYPNLQKNSDRIMGDTVKWGLR